MPQDILVVSPCSGSKQFDAVIGPDELDTKDRTKLLEEYPDVVAPAHEMYTGREHNHIKAAVQQLSKTADVDWSIISAGFGLLDATTPIPSYECTFNETDQVRQRAKRFDLDVDAMTNDEMVTAVAHEKQIPQDLQKQLNTGYDVVFVVLGSRYLLAAQDALNTIPKATNAFAFAAKGSKAHIGDCKWIPATETERSALETTWLELRGKQLHTLSQQINPQYLHKSLDDPENIHKLSTST